MTETRPLGDVLAAISEALAAWCASTSMTAGLAAHQAGVPSRFGWDLAKGRAIPAEYFLRFCAHLRRDPATGQPMAKDTPVRRGPISWTFLAAGLSGRLLVDKLTVRAAAESAWLSPPTISRATDARVMSLASFLDLSRWLGQHPNDWTVCETPGAFHAEPPLKHVDVAGVSP